MTDAVGRAPVVRGPVGLLGVGTAVLLLAVAARYGPHRDEMYFVRVGGAPAWGYVDQPPLTPLLAHAVDALTGGSLVGLRVPSALMAGLVVVLTGLLAAEFGGGRRAQVIAAASAAVSSFLLATAHLLSTTTVDVLIWTLLSWLVVRALRDGGAVWLAVGAVAGIGLENKLQPAFLLGALLIGVLAVGPRAALRSRWPWLGGAVALALWAPNLVWQAAHGFPMFAVAASIAAGGSASSQPWYLFLPFLVVLVSPLLVPVWALGWWRLARDPALATWRAFALASALLVVVFMATGGKPYYVAGLYPVLLAAGGEPVAAWTRRSVGRARVFVAALALALINNALIVLPVLPVTAIAVSNALNPDLGETVGWPKFAETVAGVRAGLPDARVAVLARNYGEAGAVDRYLPALRPGAQRPQRVLGPRAAARRRDRRHRRRVPGGAAAGLVRAGRAGRGRRQRRRAGQRRAGRARVGGPRPPRALAGALAATAPPGVGRELSGARRRPSPRGPAQRRCRWPSGRARRTRGRAPGRPGPG